jgi:uncharacterized protein (DUF58 family)
VILPTRRSLWILGLLAAVGLLGFLNPVALDVLLAADAALLVAVVVDATLAPDPKRLMVKREAPDSFSVGRSVAFRYRWENRSTRSAQLLVREVRPGLLGGVLAPRALRVEAGGSVLDPATATPERRGRETAGWFAVRSRGPLGLGQKQRRIICLCLV